MSRWRSPILHRNVPALVSHLGLPRKSVTSVCKLEQVLKALTVGSYFVAPLATEQQVLS